LKKNKRSSAQISLSKQIRDENPVLTGHTEFNKYRLLHVKIKKKSSHQFEVQESVHKTAKQFFPPNLAPGVSLNLK